jgi:hypothetical protein
VDGCPAGGEVVELGEFLLRGGKADLESFGFAVPALAFSLGDAGQQVAADVFQPRPPGEVDPEERAPEVPLTELSRGPGLASAGGNASDWTGIRLPSAVIGHCG